MRKGSICWINNGDQIKDQLEKIGTKGNFDFLLVSKEGMIINNLIVTRSPLKKCILIQSHFK
jgi:hypothetical protein